MLAESLARKLRHESPSGNRVAAMWAETETKITHHPAPIREQGLSPGNHILDPRTADTDS